MPPSTKAPLPQNDVNLAIVRGTLSRDPAIRELPSGDVVITYQVTVRAPGHRTDTVPVVRFNTSAGPQLACGDDVTVVGRVRRRFYRQGNSTQSSTEIVADRVILARHRARAAGAIEQALQRAFAEP